MSREADLAVGVGDRHDLRSGGADRREHAGHAVPGHADRDVGRDPPPGLDALELGPGGDEVSRSGKAPGQLARGHQYGVVPEGAPAGEVVLVAKGDAIERNRTVPDEGDLHGSGEPCR